MQALQYEVVLGSPLSVQVLFSGSTRKSFVCASLVFESSTGKYFVPALQYKVVLGSPLSAHVLFLKVALGSTLCKLCSTKWYSEVLCLCKSCF